VTGFYKVLVPMFSLYSTDGAVNRIKMASQIIHFIVCINFHRFGLLARFV
jgi:hypothetical protein